MEPHLTWSLHPRSNMVIGLEGCQAHIDNINIAIFFFFPLTLVFGLDLKCLVL